MQRSSKKMVQPPLTPHFSGFDFENPSDVDWLNLPREKVRAWYECAQVVSLAWCFLLVQVSECSINERSKT